jgi:DNA-binding GntR family transcriptional regulator
MAANAKPNESSEVLHLAVAQRLRALIVEGGIAPGSKLNERQLAERLHVSRTPLREALKLLTAEGLVEHLPNRGVIAVQLSADDVAHAFEVMAALEGLSGELACARITDGEVAELQALNYEMRAHHARRDLPAYYRLNARIHQAINRAAGNPVLTETYERLNARLQALRFRSNFDAGKWDIAVREHDAMVAALAARDGARLRRILVEHLQHKRDVVLAQLKQSAPASVAEAGAKPRVQAGPAAGKAASGSRRNDRRGKIALARSPSPADAGDGKRKRASSRHA